MYAVAHVGEGVEVFLCVEEHGGVYVCMRGALSETYLMHVCTRWSAKHLVADIGFAMAIAIADRWFVYCHFIKHCVIRRTNERQNC